MTLSYSDGMIDARALYHRAWRNVLQDPNDPVEFTTEYVDRRLREIIGPMLHAADSLDDAKIPAGPLRERVDCLIEGRSRADKDLEELEALCIQMHQKLDVAMVPTGSLVERLDFLIDRSFTPEPIPMDCEHLTAAEFSVRVDNELAKDDAGFFECANATHITSGIEWSASEWPIDPAPTHVAWFSGLHMSAIERVK